MKKFIIIALVAFTCTLHAEIEEAQFNEFKLSVHLDCDTGDPLRWHEILPQPAPPQTSQATAVREVASLEALDLELFQSKEGTLTYLECYSLSCKCCTGLSPIYDRYSLELGSNATFLKVCINVVPEVIPKYRFRKVPTLIILMNNTEVDRKTGVAQITEYFETLMHE